MIKKFILLTCIVFIASACSIYHVSSKDTTADYYPSKNSPDDVVYLQEIDRPYDIIGYVTVTTERSQPREEIVMRIKREAAILGADAVIDLKTDATGTWKRLPAQKVIGNSFVRANFTATAIVFK